MGGCWVFFPGILLSGSSQGSWWVVHHCDLLPLSIKSRGTHPVTCQDHIAYKGLIWQLNVGPLGSESMMLTTVLYLFLAGWAAWELGSLLKIVGTSNCLLELLGGKYISHFKNCIFIFTFSFFFLFLLPTPCCFHGCMLATVHTCGGQKKTTLWVLGSKFRPLDTAARVSTHWAPIAPTLEPIFIPVF